MRTNKDSGEIYDKQASYVNMEKTDRHTKEKADRVNDRQKKRNVSRKRFGGILDWGGFH